MKFKNKKTNNILAGMLLAAAAASPASADVLVQYNFDSTTTPLAASTVGSGISSATSITFGGFAAIWSEPAGVLQDNPGFGVNSAALTVATGNYATFTLASTAPMNLSSLTLDGGYGQFSNPAGYAVETSVDGFSSIFSTASFATQSPTLTTQTIDLSGASFQGLSSISVRVFGYVSNGGSERFDNFTVNGSIASVPEPGVLALAGIGMSGLFGLMAWRRRN